MGYPSLSSGRTNDKTLEYCGREYAVHFSLSKVSVKSCVTMQRYNILCSSASANSKPILTVIQPIQQQRKLVQMEVIQRNILLYLGTRRQPYC